MPNDQLSGFLQGFTGMSLNLLQFKERQRQHEEQQALQKEQLRILRDRAKGQQADFELKQAEALQKLMSGQREQQGQEALARAFAGRFLPGASTPAEGGEFGPGTAAAGQVGDLSQYLAGGGDVKTATGLLPEGMGQATGNPEEQAFKSLISQGFSPLEAYETTKSAQRGATETGMAMQMAGGDPERALEIMRKQREASRAQTNIQIGQKEERRKEQQRITASVVTQDITRVLSLLGIAQLPTTGAVGAFLSRIPGTASANMRFLLDTIKANIGFEKLQEMRAASPKGGALGQVSERENDLLQATLGSLDQAQTQEQFTFNLKRIHDQFLDTVHGVDKGPPRLLSQRQRLDPTPAAVGNATPPGGFTIKSIREKK